MRTSGALAIAAHPDDIEFMMAGTLCLLREAGWEIHYLNMSSGNLGSLTGSAAATARTRRTEARAAAALLGAVWHPAFCSDLEIVYDTPTLRRVIRRCKNSLRQPSPHRASSRVIWPAAQGTTRWFFLLSRRWRCYSCAAATTALAIILMRR